MKTLPAVLWAGIVLTFVLAACRPAAPAELGTPAALAVLPVVTQTPSSTPAAPTPTPFRPLLPTLYLSPTPSVTPTPHPFAAVEARGDVLAAMPEVSAQETINIILIGADRRGGGRYFRTDTLIIAILRPNQQSVSLLSIPRDLYVNIPTVGMNRINTAYLEGERGKYPGGGPALLAETIRYNLGVRIDHHVLVDFKGFREIIDGLGGVDVRVACPYTDWHIINPNLSEELESNWQLATVGPGIVRMDGAEALWYARSRMKSSDFDRGRRQQDVLRAIFARVLQPDWLARAPELYQSFSGSVTTDLTFADILTAMPYLARLQAPQIRSYYIFRGMTTAYTTSGGAAVLLPQPDRIRNIVQKALAPPDARDETRLATQVEIWNLTPFAGWDELAAERLNYAGYAAFVGAAQPGVFPAQTPTLLIDLTAAGDVQRNANLLADLGLPTSRLLVQPDPSRTAQYLLVLGADYNPCFEPHKLTH